MELQVVEHEVYVGVELDDVAPAPDGILHGCRHIAQRHLALGAEAVAVAVPLGAQVGYTLVLAQHGEAVVDVAAEVEVELVLVPRGPEVAQTHVDRVAQLVHVELHVAQADVPCGEVVLGAVVAAADVVACLAHDSLQRAVGKTVVEVVVVLVVEVGVQLQFLLDDVLAEEGDAGNAVVDAPVVGDAAPGGEVVEAHAVGLLLVAGGAPVEVGQRGPVVAHTQTQVVVVELGGGLADNAGGLDSGRLVERLEAPRRCHLVAEHVVHAADGVGDADGEVEFIGLHDDRAIGALHQHTLVVYILFLCLCGGACQQQGCHI